MKPKLRTWMNRKTKTLKRSAFKPGANWVEISDIRIWHEKDGRQHFQFDLGKNVTVDVIETQDEKAEGESDASN